MKRVPSSAAVRLNLVHRATFMELGWTDVFIEHIARLVTEGQASEADFRNLLNQTASKNSLGAVARLAGKAGKPPPAALSSHYHCIQCSETGSSTDINKHAKKTGHGLAIESRSWALYCASC